MSPAPPALLALVLSAAAAWAGEAAPLPGQPTPWHGYDQHRLSADGQEVLVVAPKQAAAGRPWIWRAEFFGHEPQVDVALLGKGWHVVHAPAAAGRYGGPRGVAAADACYALLVGSHGFHARPALEGFSRGGLLVYNWAAAHPDRVACIYADAPVLDIASWPGGMGAGTGSREDWRRCLAEYGLDEASVAAYRQQPLDRLEALAAARIPLLHVCGDADQVVPLAENTARLERRYRELGGEITVILKPGVGHHPHSLADPTPIVDFILRHAP